VSNKFQIGRALALKRNPGPSRFILCKIISVLGGWKNSGCHSSSQII
jgi:hypothetical protein